jgi:Fur family transcriptional regulator, zinc uptake regulator
MGTKKATLSDNNRKVLALLAKAAKPLSAYDVLAALRRYGFRSPPIVYRALNQLVEQGLVHRIESINSFVVCKHDHHGHQHSHSCRHHHVTQFAICNRCGTVQEIDDPALLQIVQRVEKQFLARVDREVFEISGVCQKCSQKPASKGTVAHTVG